jgi:hypothetical protein
LEILKPITVEEKGYEIYRFEPYSEDTDESYVTYCTPECAKAINLYLEDRKKGGEKIMPESPFITHKIDSKHVNRDRGFLHSKSIQKLLDRERYEANIMSSTTMKTVKKEAKEDKTKRVSQLTRKEVMRAHGFRKFFNTKCVERYIYPTVKEALMGHKTQIGLDDTYWKPTDEKQLLTEYVKVIDALTINEEERLRIKATQLEKRVEDVEELKRNLDQKDYQIKKLTSKIDKVKQDVKEELRNAVDLVTTRIGDDERD